MVARGETLQALGGLQNDWLLFMAEHHDIQVALQRWAADSDTVAVTQEETDRAQSVLRAWLRQLELVYLQDDQGLAEEYVLEGYGFGAPVFRSPRFRDWWPENRAGFHPGFVEFFDG